MEIGAVEDVLLEFPVIPGQTLIRYGVFKIAAGSRHSSCISASPRLAGAADTRSLVFPQDECRTQGADSLATPDQLERLAMKP